MLYKGNTFFNRNKIDTPLNELTSDIEADYLVVGGGITGLLLCEKLIRENKNVTLIEENDIASGSSSANTGLLQWMSDKPMFKMVNEESPGIELYTKCLEVIDYIENIVKVYNIQCEFKRCSSTYHASDKDDLSFLKKEYNILSNNNFPVSFRNNKLISRNDASMNCYLFTKHLYLSLKDKMTVYKAKYFNNKNSIAYTKSNKISYNKIFFTAGYKNLSLKQNKNCVLEKTHVVVTKKIKKNIQNMHWETKRPYLYIKPVGDRILIGGLDKEKSSLDDYKNKSQILLEKAMILLNRFDLKEEYSYSAYFGSTHSGFPAIDTIDNAYYIYNMGGNGVLYSVLLINTLK